MGFFDLNIPYEASNSSKETREKIVRKTMELGYTGIAYNRTIKGVMSDRDSCSISPFSFNTLLNVPPSLAYNIFSVNFHRDLLGIPRSSPFRQYTRLTVCVDSPAQCQALNGGNPILKSYDLIAVRPLNQSAFDIACEKSEVDIIAIDFSKKLPFRLKLPMVKAAMERGIYFEITYSDLIVSVEIRSQMISNAKLLVDWTRGRNLILSSAAPSVYEIRGPYDVMNLTSLLGLSVERAKAALSKNCRNLIVNSLKKKHFYKEAIRVELISSDEKSDSKGPLSAAWLKWDPISSGEGDLQLEDIEKSFTATTRVSNSVKPIDFVSIINSIPSRGGNFLTAAKTVEVPANEAAEMPFMATGVSEKLGGNSPSKSKAFDRGTSQELLVPSDDSKTSINSEDIRFPTNNTDEVPKNLNNSNPLLPPILTPKHDLQSQKNIISCELNTVMPNEDVMHQTPLQIGLATICAADNEMENISENRDFLSLHVEKARSSQGSDAVLGAQNVVMGKNMSEMSVRDQEGTSVTENILGREELMESADDMIIFDDNVPFLLTSGDMKVKDSKETMEEAAMEEQEHGDVNLETCKEVAVEEQEHWDADLDTPEEVALEEQEHGDVDIQGVLGQDSGFDVKHSSSGANFMLLQEVPIEEQKHEEADSESNCPTLVSSLSGKNNGKHRATRQPLLFPLKRLLNPISFKKKSKKFRHKRKV